MVFLNPDIFNLVLIAYLLVALYLVNDPLLSACWFIFFRAVFQVAAFKGVLFLGIIPYFLLPILVLAINTLLLLSCVSNLKFNAVFKLYMLFIVIVIIFGLVNFEDASSYFDFLIKILCPLFIYILVFAGIKVESDVYKALRLLVYSSTIPMAVGIVQLALGGGYDYKTDEIDAGERIVGTIIDPNLYGIYLALSLFALLPLLLKRRNIRVVGAAILAIVSVVVAQNRGTWIALAASLFLTVSIFARHLRIAYWIGTALIVFVLATPIIAARFANLSSVDKYGQSENTFTERMNHHLDLLSKSLDSPITGGGIGSAETPITRQSDRVVLPHNDYVRVAVEVGYIGLLLYVLFLTFQYTRTLKYRDLRHWDVQFAAHCMQIYIIVISFAQNVLGDVLSYSIFMYILAVAHRAICIDEMHLVPNGAMIRPLLRRTM